MYHKGESVLNLCFETGIPRSTVYSWINHFDKVEKAAHKTISLIGLKGLQRQLERKDLIIDILQSVNCTYQSSLKDKLYELKKLQEQHQVRVLCDALNVDRGTFYNHILRNKKQDTCYSRRKEKLSLLIREIYDESNQIYGASKFHAVLKERGVAIVLNIFAM